MTAAILGSSHSNLPQSQFRNAAPAEPDSQIKERLVALGQQASDLNGAVSALEQRLQSVLLPIPGSTHGADPKPPRVEECPLSEALLGVQEGNEDCISRIREILGRLAL